ncbi:MAG: chromosome partitioning protein [Treponema sp.]|jgi:phage shock protein A|nr:chromosome partitioning protein [Treponema sp.]
MQQDNLFGMNIGDAKEYIVQHLMAFKLNRKRIEELNQEIEKWNRRIELARSKGENDLAGEAELKANQLRAEYETLAKETDNLKMTIDSMRRQLPSLAASERNIDPDLLEQELLITAGYNPGDEEKVGLNRKFADLEKDASADIALEVLKKKMHIDNGEKL